LHAALSCDSTFAVKFSSLAQSGHVMLTFFIFWGSMDSESVHDRVQNLVKPVLDELSMELVDLEFKREGRDWFLRLFIDKEGGVTLDDCAGVSREVSSILEVEDPVSAAYHLEVSSPGLDRPLKTAADYELFVGRLIKLKTYEKLDPDGRGHERKTFVGILRGFQDEIVSLEQNDKKGGVVSFPLAAIAKANLELEF
jgi:ribosome maturation factor RimP